LDRAVYCLRAKSFLPASGAAERTFGYFLDEKSYPGKKAMYVVEYSNASRPDDFVFTLFVTEHDRQQIVDIQNNARFKVSKYDRVSFVAPPLGGTWVQEHLVSAIQQIEKQPKVAIAMKNSLAADSSVRCEAYTDAQSAAGKK
jgi:hypothetical protein